MDSDFSCRGVWLSVLPVFFPGVLLRSSGGSVTVPLETVFPVRCWMVMEVVYILDELCCGTGIFHGTLL